jgi:hypothetical protein
MIDLLTVTLSMVGLVLIAWFVRQNDEPGNSRPQNTILAMQDDPSLER